MTADLINPAALLAAAPALQAATGVITNADPVAAAESGEPAAPSLPLAGFARTLQTVQASDPSELPGFPIPNTESAPLTELPVFAAGDQPISSGTDPPPGTLSTLPMPQLLQETAGRPLPESGNDLPPLPQAQVIESPLTLLQSPEAVVTADSQSPAPATPPINPAPGDTAPALAREPLVVRVASLATGDRVAQPPDAGLTTSPETGSSFQDGQQHAGRSAPDGQDRGLEHWLFSRESAQAESRTARLAVSSEAAQHSLTPVRTEAPGSFVETLTELRDLTGHRPLQPLAGGERFAGKLGDRLILMADNGVQSARLKLHPEHLGPLDVRIQIDDDVAQVWFAAQHGQTREALEAAIPRLREMFAEQGLQLSRADVESGEQGQTRGEETDSATGRSGDEADLDTSPDPGRTPPIYTSRRLLDIYV